MNVPGLDALRKEAAARLTAGCVALANRAKDVLSVPAPRRRVQSRKGFFYYVATTPATSGAPPRKLSGTGRARVTYEVDAGELKGRVGLNLPYMRVHEQRTHPWLSVALALAKPEIEAAMGSPVVGIGAAP